MSGTLAPRPGTPRTAAMDIRRITPRYAVSPQIRPDDVPALKEAGFVRVICNRPDSEVAGEERAEAIAAACADHGLDFVTLPVDHASLTPDLVARQREAIEEATGPVFAYCRSGTRCTHVWALGQAGRMPVEEIVAAGGRAGYDLTTLRPALEATPRG